jgi:hypothetical protein
MQRGLFHVPPGHCNWEVFMDHHNEWDEIPESRSIPRQPGLGDDPAMRMLLPVGLSGWAIAAGYLGLISVLCFPAPLALLTGILAIREISRNPKKHGMGRALLGIVMGSLGTVFLIITVVALLVSNVK